MAAAAAAPREGSPKACKAKTVQAARKQYDYSTLTYDNHEEIVRNSLFVLPYSVVIDVLSQWISILDLCRFDTALCNKFLRFEYYETNDVLFSNQFLMDGRIPRVVGNGAGGTSADDYSYNRAEIDRIPNISTRKASGEDDTYTHHVKSAGFGATKAIAAGVMDGKSNSLDRSDVLPENREIKEHISHWECPRKISYYLWLYMRQIRVQHLEIHLDYCKDTRLDQLSSVRMHAKFANSHGGGSCSSGSAIIRTNNTDNLPSTPASLDSSGNSCANTPSSVISPASSLTASASPVKVDSYVRDQNSEAPLVQETAAAEHIQEEPCTILSPSTYYSAPQRSYYSECIPRFRDDNITKDLNKDINNGRVSRMIQNIDFSALLYLKILPQRKAFSLEVLESIFRSCDLLSVLDITDCKFPFKFLLGYPSHVPLLKKLIG